MIWRLLTLVLLLQVPAFGQGSIRRFDSITRMLAMNPAASAVSGKLSAEVLGKESPGDWGAPRVVEWLASSSDPEEDGYVYDSPFGGQWVFPDRNGPTHNRAWFDISGVVDESQSAKAILSKTNASASRTVTLPAAQLGGPFTIWSSTNHGSERVRLDTNRLMFGTGVSAVDAGIERTGVGEIMIRTNAIIIGSLTLGEVERARWSPEWMNVRDFGAVGDGVADDSAAFQNALDYAGGSTPVYFSDGIYRLASPILLNHDYQTLMGDGYNSVLKIAHNGHGFSHVGVAGGKPRRYGWKFLNFRMIAQTGYLPEHAFHVDDVSYSIWEKVFVTAGAAPGFNRAWSSFGNYDIPNAVWGGNWGNTIRDCELWNKPGGDFVIFGSGGPSSTGGPNDLRILDSYVSGALGGSSTNGANGAIFLENCNMVRVANTDMESFSTNGIWIGTNVQSASIVHNRFEIQGGTTATRHCIRFSDYTTQGHAIFGNMMLIQGAGGSSARIYGPVSNPTRIPATILDASYEGANQILADTLLIGLRLDTVARTYGPYGNKLIVMDTELNTTNSLVVGSYDGTVNPRLTMSQIGTNDNRITSASSIQTIPLSLWGSVLMAEFDSTGSGILGTNVPGGALSVYGSILAGPNPKSALIEGYSPMDHGVFVRSTNYFEESGFHAQVVDGTNNRRVRLSVDQDRVVLADGYSVGTGRIDFESGAAVRASVNGTGLEIPVGMGISLDGVYRTKWPNDASDIVGLSEWIDDRIGTTIVGGTDISVSYNDAGDTLTISYTGSGGGGGGTNSLKVDGVAVTDPNLQDGDVQFTAAGSDITATLNSGSVTYSKIQSVTAERLLGRQSGSSGSPQELTAGDGLLISGTALSVDIEAGANVQLATNGSGKVTISAVIPAGTNGWQIGVDSAIVSTPNLADSTGIAVTASSTNVQYALQDRDWGDISSSGSGLTLSIDSGAVTYAKIQNLSTTNLLLGRGSASTGPPQEISIGSGLAMSGTTLVATGTNVPVLSVNSGQVPNGNLKDSTDFSFVIQDTTNITGTINAGSVTFNKMQSISQNRLAGRYSSGAGEIQPIVIGPAFDALSGTFGITNSDKGDITTSGGGTSWSIDSGAVTSAKIASAAVTYDKIQDITQTNAVLGFGAGTAGDVKELTVGAGLKTTTTSIEGNYVAGTNVVLTQSGNQITINAANRREHDSVANLLLVTTNEVTDVNQDNTFRSVMPSARSGMSATIDANTFIAGDVIKVELMGEIKTSDNFNFDPQLKLIFDGPGGSDYEILWSVSDPGSTDPLDGTTWTATAIIIIQSAGSPASITHRSQMILDDGATQTPSGGDGYFGYALAGRGVASGSLDTTGANTIKLEYAASATGSGANMNSFKVTSMIIWML